MSATIQIQQTAVVTAKASLLDQIQLRHGPVAQLGRFFLIADRAAHELGISLQLHTNMASLFDAYREVQPPGRNVPALPIFDPAYNDLSAANAFWISGRNEAGQIVATQAARFYDMTGTNVEVEHTSLRLMYGDPTVAPPGMRIDVDCPPTRDISGRVVFSGGAYYHKSVRGRGLSRILPRISRALAYTQWNTQCTFGWVEDVLVTKNIHTAYGYTNHLPYVKLVHSNRGNVTFDLVWMYPEEMLTDLAAYVSETTSNLARKMDVTETNVVPPRRQGSSNLS